MLSHQLSETTPPLPKASSAVVSSLHVLSTIIPPPTIPPPLVPSNSVSTSAVPSPAILLLLPPLPPPPLPSPAQLNPPKYTCDNAISQYWMRVLMHDGKGGLEHCSEVTYHSTPPFLSSYPIKIINWNKPGLEMKPITIGLRSHPAILCLHVVNVLWRN